VSWSPCGRSIASASRDGSVQIWNAVTGVREDTSGHLLHHTATMPMHVVAWSPDGHTLAWAGSDWAIHIWNVHTSQHIQVLSGHLGDVIDIHWSHDNCHLASGGEDGFVHVWDALTLSRPLISYQTPQRRCICAVQWSPDGKMVAFLEAGRRVQLLHVATGMPVWCHIHGTDAALGDADEPDDEAARIGDLAFSSDGSLLASVGNNGVPWLWDVATGTHVGSLHSAENVRVLAFQPSLSTRPQGLFHLVTGSWKGMLQIWPLFVHRS
jgi:WD40 repeat protein